MRKKPRRHIVDFYNPEDRAPKVGDVVRSIGTKQQVLGYVRVLSVRQVKVKVSRGECARYSLQVEQLEGKPPEGANWTMWRNPCEPRTPRDPSKDRFSPLLEEE